MSKFYITAAIPYVNARPHIGHALEFVQTDTIMRFHRLLGEESASLSGGDENALKNVQVAQDGWTLTITIPPITIRLNKPKE